MTFNPYRQWLQVETGNQPPNHYQLLGLPLFATDSATIHEAYESRYARIRQYQVGTYSEHALRLLDELSFAFQCLTDDASKAVYDAQLREALAARQTLADEVADEDTLVVPLEMVEEPEEVQEYKLEAVTESERVDVFAQDPLWSAPIPEEWKQPPSATIPYGSPAAQPASQGNRELFISLPLAIAGAAGVVVLLFVTSAVALFLWLAGRHEEPAAIADGSTVKATAPASAVATSDAPSPASEAFAPLAPDIDVPPRDGSDVGPSSGTSVAWEVVWQGKVSKVLIQPHADGAKTLHLLVQGVSSEPMPYPAPEPGALAPFPQPQSFEVISTDPRDVQGAVDFLLWARDPIAAPVLLVRGTLSPNAGLFSPQHYESQPSSPPAMPGAGAPQPLPGPPSTTGIPVVAATSLTPAKRYFPSGEPLSSTDRATLEDLLTVGKSTSFVGTILHPPNLLFNQVVVGFQNQVFVAQLPGPPGGWPDSPPPHLDLVARNVGRYEAACGPFLDVLVLEAEVRQPLSGNVAQQIPAAKAPQADSSSQPESQSLPQAVQLPEPGSAEAALASLANLPGGDWKLELDSSLIDMLAEYRFVAKQQSAGDSPEWSVLLQKAGPAGVQEAEIARFAVREYQLWFRWAEAAAQLPAARQLRNCLLQLATPAEKHQLALRLPMQGSANQLPSEAAEFQIPLELPDLPKPELLRLEMEVSYNGTPASVKGNSTVTRLSKRLDFSFVATAAAGEPPPVEVQVTLRSLPDGVLALQAVARLDTPRGRVLRLTDKDVDEHQARIERSVVSAQNSYNEAVQDLEVANARYANAVKSADRARLLAVMNTQRRKMSANLENLNEMQRAHASIGELRSLVAAVQSGTELRYRIYGESATAHLPLVDGGLTD